VILFFLITSSLLYYSRYPSENTKLAVNIKWNMLIASFFILSPKKLRYFLWIWYDS